jgi:hypothetical protein
MAASVNKIPGNFRRLHQGEEFVRGRSLEAIEHADDLLLHLEVSEKAADIIHYFVHRDEHRDDDDLIVRLLGIRMFNCLNATLKLLLSGYYQASTLQQRDIIETFFLLDYFLTDQSLVARWRLADDKTLRSEFSPVNVRKALDARDAFTGEKRAARPCCTDQLGCGLGPGSVEDVLLCESGTLGARWSGLHRPKASASGKAG